MRSPNVSLETFERKINFPDNWLFPTVLTALLVAYVLLRGWTIVDNRGNRVTVSLSDLQTGIQLADSLFKNDSPDPASIRRQPN